MKIKSQANRVETRRSGEIKAIAQTFNATLILTTAETGVKADAGKNWDLRRFSDFSDFNETKKRRGQASPRNGAAFVARFRGDLGPGGGLLFLFAVDKRQNEVFERRSFFGRHVEIDSKQRRAFVG